MVYRYDISVRYIGRYIGTVYRYGISVRYIGRYIGMVYRYGISVRYIGAVYRYGISVDVNHILTHSLFFNHTFFLDSYPCLHRLKYNTDL